MLKKNKGVVLESGSSYGVVGMYEDVKARMKHQTLMQEYQELQKEVDVVRSKLEAGKQRKMILAAEVRFLQRRYQYFMESKTTINSSEKEKLMQTPKLIKQTKHTKEFSRKETNHRGLPPIPGPKLKKKKHIGKGVALHNTSPASQHHRKILHGGKEATQLNSSLSSDLDQKVRTDIRKKPSTRKTNPVLDLNHKERMHPNDTALRNAIAAFDLNSREEVFLPSRAPIFDLNEISTGDEDCPSNFAAVKFEEVKKTRGLNDEVQNDLMLSICRNAGEGPSRVGKRKISWQDPVALRV